MTETPASSAEAGSRPGVLRRIAARPVRCCLFVGVLVALAFAWTPVRVRYHLLRGRQELTEHDPRAALAQFREAWRLDPHRAETHFWLARTSRKTGDLDGLRRHLDEALRLGYEDPERLRREWWLLLAGTGRIREVEPYLADMLMNAGEDGSEICEAFVTGYCLNLRFDQALTLLNVWQAEYPDDFRPHVRRGQIHAGNQYWSKAVAAFREAVRLAPGEPEAHRQLGEALSRLGQLDEAEAHLRRALDIDPLETDTLLALAEVLHDRAADREAIQLARRVLDREPLNFRAKLLLAESALAAEDAKEAVRQATSLVELWPEDLKSRYVLARALRAAGRPEEAESHFRIYAELDRNRARLEELERQVKQRPDDPGLRYELGLLVLRHLSRGEGVAWLQSVFLYEPDHAGAHQALADYYTRVGDTELARRHHRRSTKAVSSSRLDGAARPLSPGETPK